MIAVLDTNCFNDDARAGRPKLQTILEAVRKEAIQVAVPEVVLEELEKQFAKRSKRTYREIAGAIRGQREELDKLGLPIPPIPEPDSNEIIGYRERLEDSLEAAGARIVAIPTDLRPAVAWAVHRRKPFEQEGRGFPDAVIWLTVLQLAGENTGEEIALVTSDKDLAVSRSDPRLADELADDLEDAGRPRDQVRRVSGISVFVEELGKRLEASRTQAQVLIDEGAFDAAIESRLYYGEVEQGPLRLGVDLDNDPTVIGWDLEALRLEDAVSLPGDRIYLEATARGQAVLNLVIFRADYALAVEADYVPFAVSNLDLNRHYLEAEAELTLDLSLAITANDDGTDAQIDLLGVELAPVELAARELVGEATAFLDGLRQALLDLEVEEYSPIEAIESEIEEIAIESVYAEASPRIVEVLSDPGDEEVLVAISLSAEGDVGWLVAAPSPFDAEKFAGLAENEESGAPILRGYESAVPLEIEVTATWDARSGWSDFKIDPGRSRGRGGQVSRRSPDCIRRAGTGQARRVRRRRRSEAGTGRTETGPRQRLRPRQVLGVVRPNECAGERLLTARRWDWGAGERMRAEMTSLSLAAIAATGSAILGGVVAAIALSAAARDIYLRTLGRRRDRYRRLCRLGTEAQLDFFAAVLGEPPAIRRTVTKTDFLEYLGSGDPGNDPDSSGAQTREVSRDLTECFFIDRDYYVQTISDADETVLAYSVTSRARRDRMLESVDAYRETFDHYTGLDWQEVTALALEFVPAIEAYDRAILEEIEGMAEGAGLGSADLLALNARSEIMFGLNATPPAECSSFFAGPEATAEGHVLMGQNWDWRPRAIESTTLFEVDQGPDRPSFVMLPEAGLVGKTGFNEHGIGVVLNAMVSNLDVGARDVPIHVILRGILNSSTLEEAYAAIVRTRRAASATYTIGGAAGEGMSVEVGPGGIGTVQMVKPRDGVLGHSNDFVCEIGFEDVGIGKWPDSAHRVKTMQAFLAARRGTLTADSIKEVLRDSYGHPDAICRFPNDADHPLERVATVVPIVMDLTAGSAEIAAGPPSEHEYLRTTPEFRESAGTAA